MELDTSETTLQRPPGASAGGTPTQDGIFWVYPQMRFDVVPTSASETILGRSSNSDIVLKGSEVSREHARLHWAGPVVILTDLGSTNGCSKNGVPVESTSLAVGDVVRVGEWIGIFCRVPEGRARPIRTWHTDLIAGIEVSQLLESLQLSAQSDIPVILSGPTGTGKEVLAQALHRMSDRTGPLVAVNCAALPDTLAESELFGHRKGAFTGAANDKKGYFSAAEGGTLLLDELTDLSANVQAKLLRVLETQTVVPLGDTRAVPIDVRVVAASQMGLDQAVEEGIFRADLYARLAGLELKLPPLRKRREEIFPLFQHWFRRNAGPSSAALSPDFVERLCVYDWPLNVREIVQVARHVAVLHGQRERLEPSHLPPRILNVTPERSRPSTQHETPETSPRASRQPPDPDGKTPNELKAESERFERLTLALREHGGNVKRAATALGISRQAAYRMISASPDLDLEKLRTQAGG